MYCGHDNLTTTFSYPSLTRDKRTHFEVVCWVAIAVFFLIMFPSKRLAAQNEPQYDEIFVFLSVQQIGGIDISAAIDGTTVYLPITTLFDFLKIKNTATTDLDSISGFLINPQNPFLVSKKNNRIVFKDKVYDLRPDDFIRTETNLYLKSKFFGEIFGLDCAFHFRSLSVVLTTKLELPIIREMRQEMMRANINRLRGRRKSRYHNRPELSVVPFWHGRLVRNRNATGPGTY